MIAVYCENCLRPINTPCGQPAEIFILNRVLPPDFEEGSPIRILSCSVSRVLRSLRLKHKGAGNQVQVATADESLCTSVNYVKILYPIIDFLNIVRSQEVYAKLCERSVCAASIGILDFF